MKTLEHSSKLSSSEKAKRAFKTMDTPQTNSETVLKVIIVNWNQKQDTADCIDSLLKCGILAQDLLVVDNGSTDGSQNYLNTRYNGSVSLLNLPINRGYPYALNRGIEQLFKESCEWFLLTNNDVIYDGSFLHNILEAIESPLKPDLIAPNILYFSKPDTIWYLGSKRLLGSMIGIRSFNKKKFTEKIPQLFPVDFVHGCSMLVKRNVLEEIGLFNESDLIYGDDADFSWRAKEAGFTMVAASRAMLWHKIALTMGVQSPRTRYLRIRNQIKFYRRYSSGLHQITLFIFTLFRSSVMFTKDIFLGRWQLLKPLGLGFIDGWLGINKDRF